MFLLQVEFAIFDTNNIYLDFYDTLIYFEIYVSYNIII